MKTKPKKADFEGFKDFSDFVDLDDEPEFKLLSKELAAVVLEAVVALGLVMLTAVVLGWRP